MIQFIGTLVYWRPPNVLMSCLSPDYSTGHAVKSRRDFWNRAQRLVYLFPEYAESQPTLDSCHRLMYFFLADKQVFLPFSLMSKQSDVFVANMSNSCHFFQENKFLEETLSFIAPDIFSRIAVHRPS
jgi:hypothetical protein